MNSIAIDREFNEVRRDNYEGPRRLFRHLPSGASRLPHPGQEPGGAGAQDQGGRRPLSGCIGASMKEQIEERGPIRSKIDDSDVIEKYQLHLDEIEEKGNFKEFADIAELRKLIEGDE